jgi:hypothetical protein
MYQSGVPLMKKLLTPHKHRAPQKIKLIRELVWILIRFQNPLLTSGLAQVWMGAAPCGSAPKQTAPAVKEPAADVVNNRKRAASTVQQPVHSKVPKTSKPGA